MKALLEHIAKHPQSYELASLICNRQGAGGIEIARAAGHSTSLIDHSNFATKEDFEAAITKELRQAKVDIICLAGFMRILSPDFVNTWADIIINIHPSLLPAYKGLNTHQRAIDDGAKSHGCSVHYVVADMDAGDVITQTPIEIDATDTAETLAARVLSVEHETYCRGLDIAARRLINNKKP